MLRQYDLFVSFMCNKEMKIPALAENDFYLPDLKFPIFISAKVPVSAQGTVLDAV